ncbi:formate dehydrogenase accessory sulfurtransferase FdhD [Denitromonas iodatirespirans]|uniref:Sulfur carrier protein FdhD n=1 Tax=Denitromonas iodatirespirans TaxID=2795389 RepID=A0A944DBZ2_DENI1|nr:formate dehydrogenase accessory sulfurtransferase FdhD [Denitromonas iodatirespirans]MBT0963470.1 formate dehydrogenase accessory sulfurtransferase FdhD [Denitromonas iodatirespirans]
MAEHASLPSAAHEADEAFDWPDRQLVRARRDWAGGSVESVECLIEEVPVALVYNGISHVVMLASPTDLEDFALGFSLSEGILEGTDELYDCEVVSRAEGLEVRLEIAAAPFMRLKQRRRNLAGRTGCGLCGVESLQAAVRQPAPVGRRAPVSTAAVHRAMDALAAHQSLHRATGAAHAAAWVREDGELLWVREDVGRHNALDKLIGARHRHRADATAEGFALVTSRASVEMVQKAASAGIGLLAAISAPTGMATRMAERTGLTLVGMARSGRLTAYSHPDWLINA